VDLATEWAVCAIPPAARLVPPGQADSFLDGPSNGDPGAVPISAPGVSNPRKADLAWNFYS
jgi:hypothetical protein